MHTKKIAFYLENENTVDCTNIISYNPGLGGSEYLIILTATLLSVRSNGLEISLYTNYKGVLPDGMSIIKCMSFAKFGELATINEIDYCIINYTSADNKIISTFPHLKFIIWCHNFVSWKNLAFYATRKNVIRIITVGREQLDLYRDHKAFEKSDYIYNSIPVKYFFSQNSKNAKYKDRTNSVVYVGSLVECKGFQYLAKAWPKILLKIPDAKLYIIGKGNLYNSKAKLGRYALAEEKFERLFLRHITNNERIIPSVHFLGILGKEKFDVIGKCKVGVPNPSGLTETFGLTALEMQAMGCNVTTIECPGYLDTVLNKEMLYKNVNQLADYIIRSLKADGPDIELLNTFMTSNFSYDVIIKQWEDLLNVCIPNNSYLHKDRFCLYNSVFHYKLQKEKIRIIKNRYSFLSFFPPLEKIFFRHEQ